MLKSTIFRITTSVYLVASLSGCFTMRPGQTYPAVSFSTPLGYQEVYRRMDAEARSCMAGARLQGAIFTDNQTADYHFLAGQFAEEAMKVLVTSTGASTSDVTITYVNVMGWNEGLANTLKQAILTGKTSCN